MGKHRLRDEDVQWPKEDPDAEERTIRNMPPIPNPEPIKKPEVDK